ncbi:MAG TPA: hypothetical protein VN633_17775, partial [Bryobacteraceae bacterium]|nr:hypothetical protein [Bryobacteraceae bacterium]
MGRQNPSRIDHDKQARSLAGHRVERFWVRLFVLVFFCLGSAWTAVPDKLAHNKALLPVLQSCAEVRRLTFEEAARGYAVHIKAVVTYFDPNAPDLFVQDDSGALWIRWTRNLPEV